MARSQPYVSNTSSNPSITAQIADIEERDGPRAAYASLQTRLKWYQLEANDVPVELTRMERRLAAECTYLSQGR